MARMVPLVTSGLLLAKKPSLAKAAAIEAKIYYFYSRVIIANGEPADLSNCTVAIAANDTYVFRGAHIPARKG